MASTFTQTVTVVSVAVVSSAAPGSIPAPNSAAPAQVLSVVLQQPGGAQFTITDAIANAAKYTAGASLTLTLA